MENNSTPFLTQEDYEYIYTYIQDLETDTQTSLNKKPKIDEQEINQVLGTPTSYFENSASEMADWDEGRVRKSTTPPPAASYSGGTAVEDASHGGRGGQRRLWVKERSKGWWKYHNSDGCPDEEFRKAFRMSKATFNMICNELESAVTKKDTMLRMAIPVRQRVAVCIYRLATGDPLRKVSALFGLGISTCHKLVLEVCAAIKAVLMHKFIQWPDQERLKEIKTKFGSISGIPDVGGAIYTTHISIIAPKTNPEAYFNRKHTDRIQKPSYSTTVQGVVDERGVFTDVCIGYPGSMADDKILERSALCKRSEMGVLQNTWIVGNSGYPLSDWMLVPYTHPNLTWGQHSFNESVGKVEKMAKEAFMRLKGRWGCLQKRTEMKLQELPMVLGACCVLHNICEMNGEEMDGELRFELYDDEMVVSESESEGGWGDKSLSADAVQNRDSIAHNLLHGIHGVSVFN
ncbi:protein ANTAGONIST OF LIKE HETEROCHROMATIN PROTEIN 1-like [Cynara cardunculus var. scolymus]|uniref:Harbinger transposase-derived nuclease n=1 Tax=Cynara cardunculus var. scolymus TaxID=59895 RepID=A0A103Y260_CYNCS|nr:protein ANTAGONIST OF LIKE HETEROCHROMATIN PROTEIN 1-like [Cynara cardunculus var. scolymus]KVI01147.1 Harbinger transposase-derived nuclease [Cynara cardunculus var. scolymus]